MRDSFHSQIDQLNARIVRMGQLVAEMIEAATLSLARQDEDLARRVIASDDEIDRMFLEVQRDSLQMLALQQPMASDLRRIVTGLKLVTDLERMADLASNIAKNALAIGTEPLHRPMVDMPRMASIAMEMTRAAMDAFVHADTAAARAMIVMDDEIDHLFKAAFDEILMLMQETPSFVKQGTYLLHTAHHLERIGDHATNLGEWTIYMVTGIIEELNL